MQPGCSLHPPPFRISSAMPRGCRKNLIPRARPIGLLPEEKESVAM